MESFQLPLTVLPKAVWAPLLACLTTLLPPLAGKLMPLQSDRFHRGGLMEKNNAPLQQGRQS